MNPHTPTITIRDTGRSVSGNKRCPIVVHVGNLAWDTLLETFTSEHNGYLDLPPVVQDAFDGALDEHGYRFVGFDTASVTVEPGTVHELVLRVIVDDT